MSASSSDLKLALEISADAAKATKALIDTKANVTDLTQTLSVAQTESNALKQAFDEAAQKTDSLGTQTALAKKALNDMATNGIAKTHADYKALEGEIANMEAELKRLLPELRNHEKAYQNSSTALEALRNRLNQATDSVQAQESALRRAGVDVGNLAREYDRLSKEASSAASLDMARGVLDVKPHQAVRAEIQQTRDAYETLRSSGQLSSAELAQAAVKAEEKIAELHRSTNGWADSLGRAKLAFVEAAGAGLGMKTLIAEAVEFETGLMAVEKTTGLSRRQLEGLGETLKHLSGELPIAAGGLAKIAEQGGQLGIASNQLENFTRLAAKMATAFDMSAEASGEAVAKLKNNFRLGLDAVEKLGDAVNVLGNNTAAKEASIIDTLTRIGGTATQFGLAADQAAALSSAMLGLGMESEVAGTAINALLSKLQTARVGSKDFQEGLQQLGLSADQMAEMVRANPQRALTDFLHLLEKVDAQSRAEILTRMFGEEHQDEISRLVGALGDYEKALTLVSNKGEVAGSMTREFEARMKSTQAQLDLVKNSLEVLGINLGEVFLPALRAVAGTAVTATQALADFAHTHPTITTLFEVVAGGVAVAGALKAAWFALRLAGLSAAADMAASFTASTVAMRAEAAATGTTLTALGTTLKALGSINVGAGLRLGLYLALAAEIGVTIKSLLDLRDAEKEVAQAEADAADMKVAAHARGKRVMEENQQYAKTAIASAEELKGKTADQTAAYLESLEKARRYWDAVALASDRRSLEYKQAQDESDKYVAAIEAVNAAFEKTKAQTAKAISPEASAQLKEFVAKLKEAGDGSEKAAKEWDGFVNGLSGAKLGQIADEAAQRLRAIEIALGKNSDQAKQMAGVVDTALRASISKFGIDAGIALDGVSTKVRQGLNDFEGLRASLKAAGTDGEKAGNILAQALSKLASQAQTKAELDAIRAKAVALGADGAASATQLAGVYGAVAEAALKIGDAITVAAAKSAAAHAQMMAEADSLTRKEYEQAAAFNASQTASDQAAKAEKKRAEEQQANTTVVASGLAALSAMYKQYYDQLQQYGQSYADNLERQANQLTDSYLRTDLQWADATLAELSAKFDRATAAAANLGSTNLDELRDAISDVSANLDDGKIFDGLKKQLDAAKESLSELQAQQAEATQSLLQDASAAGAEYGKSIKSAAADAMVATREAGQALTEAMDSAIQKAGADAAGVADDFAAKMRQIREDSRDFNFGIDDAIRGINRDGMTDAERRADLIRELQEKTKAAQEAIRAGDLALAQQLRDRVVEIAQSLDQAVEDGTGKILISQEKAAEQARQYLEDSRKLNAEIARAREAQAEAERKADLKAIEDRKQAEMALAKAVHAQKMADIDAAWEKERAESRAAHAERMAQLREEAAQQKLNVPGLDDPAKKPDGKKPTGLEARAKGGPVRQGQEYIVTEDGPEPFIDKDGNAWMLDSDGPAVWTAPDDGTVLPTDARPSMTRVPTPTGGDAGPRPLPAGVPDRPTGGDMGPRQPTGDYRPDSLPAPISIVRIVVEDQRSGRTYPPIDVLDYSADPARELIRELTLGASVA